MIDDALMSRALSWEDAQALLHQTVELVPDEAIPAGVQMRVVAATLHSEAHGMRQFSLVFRGPREPVHPQRTYRFRCGRLGDYAIFVTPIAQGPHGTEYHAPFSHAV